MESTNTNWSKTSRYIAGVGLALFGFFVLYLSRSVISPLILAALTAIIVRPVILWLNNTIHLRLGLAVALVYLILAILVPLALLLITPAIVGTANYLSNLDYQTIFQNGIGWLRSTLMVIKSLSFPVDILHTYVAQTVDSLLKTLDQTAIAQPEPASVDTILPSLTTALSTTFRTATGVVASLFSNVALLVFTFLASIYMSLDARALQDSILRAAPVRYRAEWLILLTRIERTWNAFLHGELTLMLFIGTIDWLGLTILGIPGAPYLGIISGLLEIVPNIGPVIATIPAVIVALLQGSIYLHVNPLFLALLVVAFYTLVQQFENNLIVPRVLGKAMDLPPLVVMIGALVGAEVGGILGVMLATPIIATMRDMVSYIYHKILGENPFPPEEEAQAPTVPPQDKLQGWRKSAVRILGRLSNKTSPELASNKQNQTGNCVR